MIVGRLALRWAFSATLLLGVAAAGAAHAQSRPVDRGYVGESFLLVPDVAGDWRGAQHRDWIRVDAHYWWNSRGTPMPAPRSAVPAQAQASAQAMNDQPARSVQGERASQPAQAPPQSGQGASRLRTRPVATVPSAPRSGAGTLVLAFDKDNAALPALMQRCQSGVTLPVATYSVSADRSRNNNELGPRPPGMPENFEYRLQDVQFIDCPIVENAPQQAIVVSFTDIQWLNWQGEASNIPVALEPAILPPLPRNLTGETRAWVLTWFAPANDVSDDQCTEMNARPTQEDYYALMSPEDAERERAALAGQGGPNYENGQMGMRGPNRLSVTMLPGIVPDPGHVEPHITIGRGVNLDGGANSRGHRNFVSEDGRVSGIDNQLYVVQGCVAGWQGHKGFIFQHFNNAMRDGQMSILVEVSGIDDDQNDREVYVTWLYSLDPMAKSGAGSEILSDFTFHVADIVDFTHYFSRVRARIVDGIVITDPVDKFRLNLGHYGPPPQLELTEARMRFALLPGGGIQGVLGGYRDWRRIASTYTSSTSEFYHGFQQPAYYNSLRRNADGGRNPVTGMYDSISTAYDLEGVPAFVVHTQPAVVQIGQPSNDGG